MTWHSNEPRKKMRPNIGKLACLVLASIMVILAMAFSSVAAVAEEPTPTPPLNLLVDGKEGPEVKTYFEVGCVKPGDSGSEPIVLKNIGTDDGALLFRIADLTDLENGITEPERAVDITQDEGELGDNLYITITTHGRVIGEGYASELDNRWQFIGLLPSGSETTIRIGWSVDFLDVGNIIQTDICTFNMDFLLEHLELTNLVVPERGYYCEEIPISVDAHNASPFPLTFDLTMVITDKEGEAVYKQTKTVTVGPDETVTVHFTWHPRLGGTVYTVTIDGLSDTIEILIPPTPTPSPRPPGGGGGGGPRLRLRLDVDMWGKVTSGERTAFGILVQTIEAVSEDGVVTLLLRERTEVLDLEGNAVSRITVKPVEEPPPLPPGASAIDAYDFTPNCTFEPAIELALLYDEEALPEGFDEGHLVIEYYREDEGGWRELPTVVDTFANTASCLIGHLTVFAIVAPPPPSLTINSLSISPSEVEPGESVTITVGVANLGTATGSRTIELWIEGELEDSQDLTLDPGAAESVTFAVSREEAGTYRVAVDGFRGEFEVVAPGFGYWPLIGGILGGLLLAGVLTYLLLRWRAAERKRHEEVTGG